METGTDTRLPRGALAVIAVGLLATLAAALLSTDKPAGAAELEWEARMPLPDSRPAAIPGGGQVRISEGGLRATDPNASGYRLYRVAAVLAVDPASAVANRDVRCAMNVPRRRTVAARTPENRAAYPLPSSEEDLGKQNLPATVTVEFNAHETDLARIRLGDAFDAFSNLPGVTVDWAPFRLAQQTWEWGVPANPPAGPVRLAFAGIWRTSASPAAKIACTVNSSTGSATVHTAGSLSR
ncbi:MAG: hypothetical protein WBM00_11670 [Solirubrobacterales bacterium]